MAGEIGVMIDGLYSVEYAINNLAIAPTPVKTSGPSLQSFSSLQAGQAKLEAPARQKTGVAIGIYDPLLSAMLGGEI